MNGLRRKQIKIQLNHMVAICFAILLFSLTYIEKIAKEGDILFIGVTYPKRFDESSVKNITKIANSDLSSKFNIPILHDAAHSFGSKYKKELIGNSFVINNPKASSSCGCGLSFSV